MAPPSLEKNNPGSPPPNNPYSAPVSSFDDGVQHDGRQFILEGMAMGTDKVLGWYGRGFDAFKAAPVQWILSLIVMGVIMIVAGVIPFIGGFAMYVLIPLFGGGIMLGCAAYARENKPYDFSYTFAGFDSRYSQLALVGVFYLLEFIVLCLVIGVMMLVLVGGTGLAAAMGSKSGVTGAMFAGGIGIAFIVCLLVGLVLGIPMLMTIIFAPVLVVNHGLGAMDAMKASLTACMKNIVPGIIWSLLCIVLALVAIIPFGLGFLVLYPVVFASQYAAYEDIFLR